MASTSFKVATRTQAFWSTTCPRPLSRLGIRYCPTAAPFSISTRHSKEHDNSLDDAAARAKRQSARSQSSTSSLRRVAVEAQRSRESLIRRSGKRRFVDPHADTSPVTAYCAAEQYDIPIARRLLEQEGYHVDPCNTALYPQVLHFQTSTHPVEHPRIAQESLDRPGDVFVFPSGTIVTWNVPESLQLDLVHHLLLPAAENSHLDRIEVEDLEYLQDASRDTSEIIGDTIILGTKSSTPEEDLVEDKPRIPASDADTVLAKIAFSSGLARSAKLAVLEDLLSSYFSSTRSIPTILSRGSKLPFTRSFILRKTGELLSIRAQLNLYSELTDSLPDIFWASHSSLGLDTYYDDVGRSLDVGVRIKVLNEKMDYASEIASVLRERLSEKHSTGLEWLIIVLIAVEVGMELWRMWRDNQDKLDPMSTEALLRELLLRKHLDAEHKTL